LENMRALKISAISFLNTVPLMWDFEHEPSREIRENFQIEYTVPSLCAKALREGTADIGIIPVITMATIPDLVALPDVAIAALNKVWSIQLVSKKPIEEIRTVAVDTSSRTSVGLTQVLLTKFFGGHRDLTPMAPVLGPMLDRCDAGLLIGDPAMMVKTDGLYSPCGPCAKPRWPRCVRGWIWKRYSASRATTACCLKTWMPSQENGRPGWD
jgi:chorismate dehydratase